MGVIGRRDERKSGRPRFPTARSIMLASPKERREALASKRRLERRSRSGGTIFDCLNDKSGKRQQLMNISQFLINVPNLITLARMLMTPLAISMIVSQRFMAAFMIFLLAGVSDAIDGFIARHFNLRTELGAYLDPLADKALLISIYVSLAIYAGLPAWLAIAVVSRDVMILVAVIVSWLMDKPVEIRPVWESKINTAAQIALAGFALGVRAYDLGLQPVQTALEWAVAATTVGSGGVYVAQWLDHMSR